MKSLPLTAALCMLSLTGHAQERATGSTLDTQMTWSALSSKILKADSKATAANVRLDQVEKCGKKGMVSAPGAPEADTDGCRGMQDNSLRWSIGARQLHGSPPTKNTWNGTYNVADCASYIPTEMAVNSGNPKTIAGARCTSKGMKCQELRNTVTWGSKSGTGGGSESYYTLFTCD